MIGLAKSNGKEPSKQDILQWFELNWSTLNRSFSATTTVPGFGRGKVGLAGRVMALIDQLELK